ncbi:MAG TPA: carboxymuconolactone decarboxylase family protein [Nocardioides sp.]|nr:carboxymuconolactone decarboxylase family protein [Nocardioides sp.]
MRLASVERAQRLPARTFVGVLQLATRRRMDPVVVTMLHRPALWGRSFSAIVVRAMRGPSYWSAAEREYMAVVVSRANECPFCLRAHTETTRIESGGRLDEQTVRPELAAVLPLLERLTRDPDTVGPSDVDAVRAAGVPDDAIEDALHVLFVFNTVNRLANTLGWSWDSEAHTRFAATMLHRIGYRLPGFTLR